MQENASLASLLALQPPSTRANLLADLSEQEAAALEWDWRFWGRQNQFAPSGDWRTWLALAGRGFGKTEAGAQWIRERVKSGARSIALVAETQKDLEEVMVARLLKISPPDEMPSVRYRPVRIKWPNGAEALGYNGTEPNQLRGPEFDTAWLDELAKYRYARETWDMLQFTMRSGQDPRVFVTTTPKPISLLKELLKDPTTVVTRGSTFDNAANLAPSFIQAIKDKYDGTRLGRQELYAELLDEAEGALWTRSMIEQARFVGELPDMVRIVVAVDPAITAKAESDETGIVVCGRGRDGLGYVFRDVSGRYSPGDWAKRVINLAQQLNADRIVAEGNQGGDMVRHTIQTQWPAAPVKIVHASRGKYARAEPVAALYEQNRVRHHGNLDMLEDQLVSWEPLSGLESPDRLDAMVWGLTELMITPSRGSVQEVRF